MAQKPKRIDWNTGLKARALWTLAASHYSRAEELERALAELLGLEDDYCGHLSDAMHGGNFDVALKKQGFVITKPTPRRK